MIVFCPLTAGPEEGSEVMGKMSLVRLVHIITLVLKKGSGDVLEGSVLVKRFIRALYRSRDATRVV